MSHPLQENKNNESNNNNKANDNKLCQKLCYSLDVQEVKHCCILRGRKCSKNYHGTEPQRWYLEKGLSALIRGLQK